MRGFLALLHAFSRIEGMNQGRPFVLGLLQEGIDHRNMVV
jgi:hypothetical protein